MAACLFNVGSTAHVRSQFAQASSMLKEAADLFKEVGDRWKLGQCQTELARIAAEQGQYEQARTLLQDSLKLYRELDDQHRLGWVRYLLARLLFISLIDPVSALSLADQSYTLLKVAGAGYRAYPLGLLGQIRLEQGDLTASRPLLEESLALHREVGGAGGDDSDARLGLAKLLVLQGDFTSARVLYQFNLEYLVKIGVDKEWVAASLEGLGTVVSIEGESEKAALLWGVAESLRETIGVPIYPVYRADYDKAVNAARAELGEEAFAAAWTRGRATPIEQVIEEMLKTAG
jgi:tetratricopeptide (TPR) repeat protein